MVRDFRIAPEESVGYYVGLITSCFALAQLLTGKKKEAVIYVFCLCRS